MERRAIRITIELPEDLVTPPRVAVGEAAGAVSEPGVETPATGPDTGGALDAGAPSAELVAALGGEPRTSPAGADVQSPGGGDQPIDAGPMSDALGHAIESAGPRHPMAESAEFQAALVAADAVAAQRN